MTPLSFVWANVAPCVLDHSLDTNMVWIAAVICYALNGVFLEVCGGKMCQPDTQLLPLTDIMPIVLFNLMSTYVLVYIPIPTQPNVSSFDACIYLTAAGIGNELIYAPVHRLLHVSWCFKYHQLHHRQKAPRALGAVYCSLVEMWVANVSSFLLPLYLMNAPLQIYMIWIVSGMQTTQLHHSGKSFIWSFGHQPKFHDDHHRFVKKNFGNLGFFEAFLSNS